MRIFLPSFSVFLFFVLSFAGDNLYAQSAQYAYRINFRDKAATTFNLQQPDAYLSTRSIARRQKYGITVDSTDLPVCATYLDSIVNISGAVRHNASKWMNSCVLLFTDTTSLNQIRQLSFVSAVKRVGVYPFGLHERPAGGGDDTLGRPTDFDQQFYGLAWNQIHMCEGEYLHQQGYMGQDVIIAVLDVGFSSVDQIAAFDSLFAQNRLLDTWNFIIDTAHVFDYGSHGTTVLSNMAVYRPDFYVGTAPQASYLLYATDDNYTEYSVEQDNFVAAAERADSFGADLISASLGYSDFDDAENSYEYSDLDGHSTIVAKAANAAARKGILPVVAAGNAGNSSWQYVITPGDADSAMTIGSVNANKVYSSFSSRGPNSAGLLKPNVCGQGQANVVVDEFGSIGTQNGTSQATPVIAGLSACLLQAAPHLPPMQLRALIESVSSHYANPNNNVGNGVPNFRQAFLNLGINKLDRAFAVYPNPTSDRLLLLDKNNTNEEYQYQIFDLQGRNLWSGNISNGEGINTSALHPGIYMLCLAQQKRNAKEYIKFVIAR